MRDLIVRIWANLSGRVGGPMTFRLFMQPTVAMILAIRAGLRDAKTGRMPYLQAVLKHQGGRHDLLLDAWKDVGRVFVAGVLIDAIYQAIVLHWFYPFEALIVAAMLALVPYALFRGPAARVMRRFVPQGK